MEWKILICDENEERRDRLKALCAMSPLISVVGECADCTDIIKLLDATKPDLVLMDINIPTIGGINCLRLIRRNKPTLRILIQAGINENDRIFEYLKNGASGYILKGDKTHRIIQTIKEVMSGKDVLRLPLISKFSDYYHPNLHDSLTPKESEVISLLAKGYSYKMIAEHMGICYSTVNTHTKHIYHKLHVQSLGEAIAFYYKKLV